ncbi:elongation factor P hydroxylase [Alteromonas sp. ASW11-36]|uniref:Elongation factor P hydroxylase n=1 Tax=Alteromonas arenosi TaxID=3055817 RepID=A0ABT7SVW1_9ALTE|nr:elongation factor P hydroxylase [Alteromonas sp. ASW11-36]MDM7860316.1 elongation factor P hydroxylase [Alteromonas sp. ASW11-36]
MSMFSGVAADSHEERQVDQLIALFDDTFKAFNTRLVRGTDEPIYLPADQSCSHNRIVFAHGYFSSALHEIAHWCIAGKARRREIDYGYWYCPDGRDAQQQSRFEVVEIKPQALEWAFSVAAGRTFGVSTDNLNGVQPDRHAFAQRVYVQLQTYCATGFPARAAQFISVLNEFYQAPMLTPQQCLSLSKDLNHAA